MSELERRHFRLLLEIDRRGTISAAARTLHLTQSAASQQVRDAERRLGFALTEPSGRTVKLTAAGRRLVDAAELGEQIWSAAEADARWLATATGTTCKLAVGVHDDLGWVARLQAVLDGIEGTAALEVVRAPDLYGFDLLADGAAHAVVAPTSRPAAFPRSIDLGDDELVGVVGTHHPLAARDELHAGDFAGSRYVTYSTTPEVGFEHDTFLGPAGVVPTSIARVESMSAILDLVATTARVSILCRRAISPRDDIRLLPLVPPPDRLGWTLTVVETPLPPAVERTVELIVRQWTQ